MNNILNAPAAAAIRIVFDALIRNCRFSNELRPRTAEMQ